MTWSGSAVMKNGLWSLAKELCKTGCVIGHRRELWCRTLAVDISEPEVSTNWKCGPDNRNAMLPAACISF